MLSHNMLHNTAKAINANVIRQINQNNYLQQLYCAPLKKSYKSKQACSYKHTATW